MKILFVCEGNVNRSQMAETMLKKLMPGVKVFSAGTIVTPERQGKSVSEISIKGSNAMNEIGYDMSANIIERLTPDMVEESDRIIVMGPTSSPLPEYLENSSKLKKWDVPDPGRGDIVHADARDMILVRVKQLVEELKQDNQTWPK